MNTSLLCLSPLIASSSACSRTSLSGVWLKSRLCVSARYRHSTCTTPVQHPLGLFRAPTPKVHEQSIWRFVSDGVLRATHRSGIGRSLGGDYGYGGGGPQGPWQRFRARVNAIPGNFIFWCIIGLNGIVFVSWNLAWAKWQSTGDPTSYIWMRGHFVAAVDNLRSGRWYTLLTACFSHEDTAHLLFNGITYYFMAPTIISLLGNVGFLGLYLGGGIVSSIAGITWRNYNQSRAQSQMSGSHGASGAIYSILSFFACVAPTATFYLFGVIPLPAWAVVTGVFIWDGYSAVNQKRNGTDTAGHVGGLLAGIGYFVAKRLRVF